MTLPIDRTALIAAQTNQVPSQLIQSAKNIAAIKVPYDTIDELNNKVNANYAAGSIGTTQLADGSVTAAKQGDLSVTTAKIAPSAVTLDKMADNSVSTSELVALSVTNEKIANATITADKFVAGALQNETQNGLQIVALKAEVAKLKNLIDVTNPPNSLSPAIGDGVTDNRLIIQNIVNYARDNGYNGVYVPYSNNPYMINANHTGKNGPSWIDLKELGIQIPSNFKFIMHPEATLKTIPTTNTFQIILNINNSKNVTISGGTLIGDRDTHGATTNFYGYGLYILGSENVHVSNMELKNFWGNAIITRDIEDNPENNYLQPCKNITFDNIIVDNAHSNGMGIVSAKVLKILNSTFKNTNGVAPQAGIDLEPNYSTIDKKLENIIIDNCTFINNASYSIVASNTIGLTINNCKINDAAVNIQNNVERVVISNNTCIKVSIISSSKETLIKNNIIKDVLSPNAGIFPGNDNDIPLIIEGNVISNCARGVQFATTGKNIIFRDNFIVGSTDYAIQMQAGNLKNVQILRNTFKQNGGYIYFRFQDSLISENDFIDNVYSFWNDSGDNNVIQNNRFRIISNPLTSINFMTIGSSVIGAIVDSNKFNDSSNTVSILNITANAGRTVPVIVRNNVSMNPTTIFTTPPAGVVSQNNYNA